MELLFIMKVLGNKKVQSHVLFCVFVLLDPYYVAEVSHQYVPSSVCQAPLAWTKGLAAIQAALLLLLPQPTKKIEESH